MTEIRTDDIGFGNLKLLQDPSEFCYGVDAVILADFAASICGGYRYAADLGTGTGVIPFILHHKAGSGDIAISVWISTRDLSGWLVKAAGSMAFVNKYTLGAAISRSLPDVRVQKLLQRMACGRAQWRTEGLMW